MRRGCGILPPLLFPLVKMFRESFDPEAHRSNREFDPSGVGLMRCCRVVPPTSSQVQLVDDLFEHEEEDVEEAPTGNSIA